MKKSSVLPMILGSIAGLAGGAAAVGNVTGKNVEKWKNMSDKHLALLQLMTEWMKTKQEGKHIKEYFEKNGYQSAAIYGLSYVGERLLDELKDGGIEVRYAVDRNADSIYADLDVYSPEEELPEADVVIVTAVSFFDEIHDNLIDKVSCPIVSLEDVIYEIG